jgi:hypothetical protein
LRMDAKHDIPSMMGLRLNLLEEHSMAGIRRVENMITSHPFTATCCIESLRQRRSSLSALCRKDIKDVIENDHGSALCNSKP